jgi:hypothetical protein
LHFNITYKQIGSFLFLTIFFVQTFSNGFIIGDYYANTASYQQNCINKARPKLLCNGKCQMMKKLQETEKKEQESNNSNGGNKNENISSKSFYPNLFNPQLIFIISTEKISPASQGNVIKCALDIFHPPQLNNC